MSRIEYRAPMVDELAVRWYRLVRLIVGDRIGAILFVGACLVYGALWQAGFLLNDTWTIANTLVGVADGHLYVDRVVYGTYLGTPGKSPGMHVVGRRLYGRNYGQVFLALPFLWLLDALAAVADPRILLAALWSLGIVLFGHQVWRLLDGYRATVVGGCLLALAAFAANVYLATPLAARWLPHLALQVSTIVAAALLVVVLYRLLVLVADRRTAAVLGAAATVSTPIAFWSTLPKRHTLSALLVTLVLYSFARSRFASSNRTVRRFRALAYAWVGLLAWVHAAEGLVVLLALGIVDLLTARTNDRRDLIAIAGAFGVSMVPFFITNALVVGNPLRPPRLWPPFDGVQPVIVEGELVRAGDQSAPDTAPVTSSGSATVAAVVTTLTDVMMRLWGQIRRSLLLIVGSPDRLYETFVRTGWSPAQARDQQAINLSVLETAPLFGVMLSLPVFAARQRGVGSPSEWPGRRQIDLLAVALTGLFLLIYLPRLPLHAQATVRYLHPIVPLLVYATARIPAIQNVIRERFRTLGWSYAAGVLLGGQLLIAALALLISSVGGAIQFQGLVNLAFAGGLAVWAVGAAFAFDDRRYLTLGSVLLGLALAAGTVTTLLLVWNHLAYGDPVLGIGHLIRVVVPP